jgi:hypothetical protein
MTVRYVPPREPICDPRTGIMNPIWYRFFTGLMDPESGRALEELAILTGGPDAATSDGRGTNEAFALVPPLVAAAVDELPAPPAPPPAADDMLIPPAPMQDGDFAVLIEPGCVTLPGNLKFQYGSFSGVTAVTYPEPFTTAVFALGANGTGFTVGPTFLLSCATSDESLTGATFQPRYAQNGGTVDVPTETYLWWAFGI